MEKGLYVEDDMILESSWKWPSSTLMLLYLAVMAPLSPSLSTLWGQTVRGASRRHGRQQGGEAVSDG